ncbi:hypothetical protein MKW94_025326 [Papaver nudicaule]|uniref:Beta-catenin-like protein 1 N-terminal domain-containing protein n=1 Tax=Papaver nudicaule TaxID=74823 RepID=A0AA41VBZ6_PAPNU|nr:hypothetical protein [Papaver nudicaule]
MSTKTSGCRSGFPLVSVTPLPPEIPDDTSTAPDLSFYPEPAEELQLIFQQRFDDYNEARKGSAPNSRMIADREDKLMRTIAKFRIIKANFPQFYPGIIRLSAFRSMLELLKDDNYCGNRLASYILLTFEKLTDDDVLVTDQDKHAKAFVESLVEYGALGVFVSVLGKFSEDDDNVFRSLQSIAQMIFLKSDVAESAGKETRLIEWVLKALGAPRWGKPKEYAVGLLNTLLMSMENRLQLGEKEDSVDEEHDEEDLLDTLSDSLILLLQHRENIKRFVDAGGVRLLIRFIQNKKFRGYYYGTAIAALGIAVKDCPSASEEFVNDDSALDIVFLAFPKIPPSVTHEKEEIQEHLASLLKLLTGGIAETKKDLLLEKFEENNWEKTTWLTELFIQYSKRAESIAVILSYLWSSKNSVISARIEKELSHHKLEKKHVQDILSTCQDDIGNASEINAAKAEYRDNIGGSDEL